jgi:hypothetical protein
MLVAAVVCASLAALTLLVYPESSGVIQTLFAQIVPASLDQGNDNPTTSSNSSNNSNTTQTSSQLLNSTGNSSSITQLATLP